MRASSVISTPPAGARGVEKNEESASDRGIVKGSDPKTCSSSTSDPLTKNEERRNELGRGTARLPGNRLGSHPPRRQPLGSRAPAGARGPRADVLEAGLLLLPPFLGTVQRRLQGPGPGVLPLALRRGRDREVRSEARAFPRLPQVAAQALRAAPRRSHGPPQAGRRSRAASSGRRGPLPRRPAGRPSVPGPRRGVRPLLEGIRPEGGVPGRPVAAGREREVDPHEPLRGV